MVPGTEVAKNFRSVTSVADRNIMGNNKNIAQKAIPLVNFCTTDLKCTTCMAPYRDGGSCAMLSCSV